MGRYDLTDGHRLSHIGLCLAGSPFRGEPDAGIMQAMDALFQKAVATARITSRWNELMESNRPPRRPERAS